MRTIMAPAPGMLDAYESVISFVGTRMSASASSARPTSLFREREGVWPNTLVLAWTGAGWLASFGLMAATGWALPAMGVLLCAHTMILAAYLIHEAAHYTLFSSPRINRWAGEAMSFIAGASYASFDRIRHLHIRHHRDRADVTCFDFKGLMQRRPSVRRLLQALEWACIPATEILMHLQVVWRPFFVPAQRRHLQPVPMDGRDRAYEQAHTYSNLVSMRFPVLNLLTLNFGYHNAHHERAAVPWWRLPALHRELYDERALNVMPLAELLRTWHRNRVKRVVADHYGTPETGAPQAGARRADAFVGAHGVSFLTVV